MTAEADPGSRRGPVPRGRDEGASLSSSEARDPALSELEVLHGVSRAFGSSLDVQEAAEASVRWVRAAVGSADARVRVFLDRAGGRLDPALPLLEVADEPERVAERRQIFESRRTTRFPVADGRVLVTIPLLSRGEAVGVLEIVAPGAAVEDRWATLEAVASHVAIVFRNLAHTSRLVAGLEGLREMAGMASEIVRAGTPEDAVRAAVKFCRQRFGRPAAGWLTRGDPSRYELVSARGLGSERGRELRSAMRLVRRADLVDQEHRARIAEGFAEIAGAPSAEATVAGDAVLLVGGPVADGHAPFRLVEGLLEDVLDHLAVVAAAERRHERLDLGIALTAHEVRGPLVGALAIIERLMMEQEHDGEDHALLHRSREQLEQLSRLVDALLRWAVAGQPLELRPTDLGLIVREAVQTCSNETGTDRVTVAAPAGVTVLADPDHLRGAVANVVRNALIYSPPDSKVSLEVRTDGGRAMATVRDRGPGVPAAERESIFDPFMRGSASHLVRSGNGLGLFIARRIMEAHSGRVWLGAEGRGAVFHLELPAVKEA